MSGQQPQTAVVSRYVVERRDDIHMLQRFCTGAGAGSGSGSGSGSASALTNNPRKRKFTVDGLRFRTRSYRPYRMSHSMKTKIAAERKQVLLKLDKLVDSTRRKRRRLEFRANTATETAEEGKHNSKPFRLRNHVWHCKRMFMQCMYNVVMPMRSRNKGFKACETVLKTGCCIQDVSYMRCISVSLLKVSHM
jgi:hypothetical protein